MNKLALAFILAFSSIAQARTIVVAVIDTGIDSYLHVPLCKGLSKDFTGKGSITDEVNHGTSISWLIDDYANASDYCQVIIKYYGSHYEGHVDLEQEVQALRYAISIKPDIINISSGGPEPYGKEHKLINLAVNRGIKVIVAAGNKNVNLDSYCNYYPACYGNLIVVGALGRTKSLNFKAAFSNYGSIVNYYAAAEGLITPGLNGSRIIVSGSSQATAKVTGMYTYALAHRLTIRQVYSKYSIDENKLVDIVSCTLRPTTCNNYNKGE